LEVLGNWAAQSVPFAIIKSIEFCCFKPGADCRPKWSFIPVLCGSLILLIALDSGVFSILEIQRTSNSSILSELRENFQRTSSTYSWKIQQRTTSLG
jgi:hypothetical protein